MQKVEMKENYIYPYNMKCLFFFQATVLGRRRGLISLNITSMDIGLVAVLNRSSSLLVSTVWDHEGGNTFFSIVPHLNVCTWESLSLPHFFPQSLKGLGSALVESLECLRGVYHSSLPHPQSLKPQDHTQEEPEGPKKFLLGSPALPQLLVCTVLCS